MHYLAVISAHAKSTEPVYSDTSLRFLQAGRVALRALPERPVPTTEGGRGAYGAQFVRRTCDSR